LARQIPHFPVHAEIPHKAGKCGARWVAERDLDIEVLKEINARKW
jgi:hypothetical protein